MTCDCDRLTHPLELEIAAGLDTIPRQIADFAQFRRAMLAALHHHGELAAWRPSDEDDLGVMLLEMWAYVCDVSAFYDEVIAHESYVRTARRRPSLRKLVGLLGYLPRPAVAASVKLAIKAEGRKVVILPRGMGFLSGAFDNEAPQVFELDANTKVHPLNNQYELKQPRSATFDDSGAAYDKDFLLLKPATVDLKVGDLVLIELADNSGANQINTVKTINDVDGTDGNTYTKVEFITSLALPAGTKVDQLKLWVPRQTASHWTLNTVPPPETQAIDSSEGSNQILKQTLYGGPPLSAGYYASRHVMVNPTLFLQESGNKLNLDGLYRQTKPGQFIIVAKENEYRWFEVQQIKEIMLYVASGGEIPVKTAQGTVNIPVPPSPVPITQIELDRGLNASERMPAGGTDWTYKDAAKVVIHHGFVNGGTVTAEAKATLSDSDPLEVSDKLETSKDHTMSSHFLLQDRNEFGLEATGKANLSTGEIKLDKNIKWTPDLVAPLQLFGNVVKASRGETVTGEILGSGDASLDNQAFKLQKKPLTYIASSVSVNERGVRSTLDIYVDGIRWTEVENFFKAKPEAQVFIVRQNDTGDSLVTFGNGRHGARLTTGGDNVVANYRYGAGATTPPAGSITQLGSPIKEIQSVHNPVAAFGGGDADNANRLRANAPRSVLTLGRAVSLQDFEALAASYPGVTAALAEWRWHGVRQRPVAQIWYIGKPGIETTLSKTLRNLADPGVAIEVDGARPTPLQLSLHVDVDTRHDDKVVLKQVCEQLLHAEAGMLAPANIGIGQPLYRSHIFAKVLAVSGTLSVSDIQYEGKAFNDIAIHPGVGNYFDLEVEDASLVLNGEEICCG